MRWPKYLLGFFILGFALYTAHALYLGKTVYGDGIYYYSWLHSIAIDHDVTFTNEYRAFGVTVSPTPLGQPGNKYAIGPALAWLPVYLSFSRWFDPGGYGFVSQYVVGATSVAYAAGGIILLFYLLLKQYPVEISALTVIAIYTATNLLFYGAVDTVNSHSISFFAVVVFLSFLYAKKKSWFAIGIALGLVGIVRPQDMIVGLLARRVKWRPFLTGVVIGFLPQILAWQALYRNPLAFPYLTGGEGFSLSLRNIFGVLFAPSNGLFLWTPITLLGLVGLWNRKNFLLIFFLQLMTIGSWSTWWQGASYSGRMFVGMLPLLAFGIAEVLSKIRIPKLPLYLLVGSLSSINSLLILYFLITR